MKTKLPAIAFVILCIGSILRVLHWPGSFFLLSIATMVTIIFTTLEFSSLEGDAKSRNIQITSTLAIIVCSLGINFKFFAWPGANAMIEIASALAIITFLLFQFFNPTNYRPSRNIISAILITLRTLMAFFPRHSFIRTVDELTKELEQVRIIEDYTKSH